MNKLAGKVAIVTGASKGMGRHFVGRLVGEGARVACLARESADLRSLVAEFGDAVVAIACDVADPGQVNAAMAETIAAFGRLDLVVNNAATYLPVLLEDVSDAEVHHHVGPNLLGVIWLTRAAIPHLRETRGQVITISSESVRNPFPMLSLYAATKAAVETLSLALRDELKSDGIRTTILRSGSVSGGSGGAAWSAETTEKFFRKIVETGHAQMTGEAATPESMAEALLAVATLPPDINADFIEVRAARAGVPEGVKALD